jgi:pyridoxal phosphate enzyme (YggS family)
MTSLTRDTLLAANLAVVRARIAQAAARAGRAPEGVTLVAVSKTFPAEAVAAVYALGVRDFGENRVEEGVPKQAGLPADIRWHMLGHVQSRKADEVARHFQLAHSVDSLKLAQRLARAARALGRELPVLLEVNVAGEAGKYGYRPGAAFVAEVAQLVALPGLRVRGLMTMAPIVAEPEQARPVFAGLRALRDELAARFPQAQWADLSMGMTDDFEVAIEEGATLVRIGRAIFGARA